MAEQKDVPTGPKGGVRVTDDDSRTVRSTQNVDPRDNTPTADQHEAQRRGAARKGANEPEVDKQGHKSYGGGGQKLKFERDYWPAQQPENKFDPEDIDPATGRPRPLLVHREHVIKAGEVASIPGEEADKLIEAGVARQHKEKKE
jgi:hypothetical protein